MPLSNLLRPLERRRDDPVAVATGPVALALQGGGAHGAFTWGVLDALLESAAPPFLAVSGSSAGAINAVLLASGLAQGGAPRWQPGAVPRWSDAARDRARDTLAAFWLDVAASSPFERHAAWLVHGPADNPSLTPTAHWLMQWAGMFSPEQLNPMDVNPLRDALRRHVDFDRLRVASPLPLFVAATQVNTSSLRLFREHELGADVLLASTCLPRWHRTVAIDGEPYWDGGFSANPPLAPLVFDVPPVAGSGTRDVLLVLLSPLRHDEAPQGAQAIALRQLELAFTAPLQREWQWLEHARRGAQRSRRPRWLRGEFERRLLDLRLHAIDPSDVPALRRSDSKLIANRAFVESLRDAGREAARAWRSRRA